MGHGFPGGYPPGGYGAYSVTEYDDGGGDGDGIRKKAASWKNSAVWLCGILIAAALVLALDALPLVLGFDPLDAADFAEAPGLAKIEAFKAGWRHKHGISLMTFSHDGKSITFMDTNGTLTGVEAEGYGYDDADELESDIEEARRIQSELS